MSNDLKTSAEILRSVLWNVIDMRGLNFFISIFGLKIWEYESAYKRFHRIKNKNWECKMWLQIVTDAGSLSSEVAKLVPIRRILWACSDCGHCASYCLQRAALWMYPLPACRRAGNILFAEHWAANWDSHPVLTPNNWTYVQKPAGPSSSAIWKACQLLSS